MNTYLKEIFAKKKSICISYLEISNYIREVEKLMNKYFVLNLLLFPVTHCIMFDFSVENNILDDHFNYN